MRITLIRHPRPLIEPGVCYGRLDIPLHPSAGAEVARIAAHPMLGGVARVWTSPARRCQVLADAIAAARSVPLTVDARLQELDFGTWEALAWDSVAPEELDRWVASPLSFAPPGGETGAALIARVRDFAASLRSDRCDCAVVSHGGPLKVLAALLSGRPVDLFAPARPIGTVEVIEFQAA
jgi:alpha-ribazole phosphatase